jgi:hypothetical protein
VTIQTLGIGGIIAVIVLILVILLAIIGKLPLLLAVLIGALAVARLT